MSRKGFAVGLAVGLGVSVALADVFVTMLCVLSVFSEPRWLEPWARVAWPAAHCVAIVSVMVWQVFLPEEWKR